MRTATDKPNIILINCDDLGYGDLACYGSAKNRTPHLDRMAAEGNRLTDFYMASPVCSPSRGAMMTGCYPNRIGFGMFDEQAVLFPGQAVGLNPNEATIASLLSQQGYRSKLIGNGTVVISLNFCQQIMVLMSILVCHTVMIWGANQPIENHLRCSWRKSLG